MREMASMYRWYKFLLYLEAHALKLQVYGICLVGTRGLGVAIECKIKEA